MRNVMRKALIITYIFLLAIATSENGYAHGKGRSKAAPSRSGFGFIYSNGISETFRENGETGFGGSFCGYFKDVRLGYGVGSLEYIRFEPTTYRGNNNYYQIFASGYVYGRSIYGFYPLLGFVGLGYHNWKENISPYVQMESGLLFLPLTFYTAGLGYEYFVTRDFSLDLSVKYSFDLSFKRTS